MTDMLSETAQRRVDIERLAIADPGGVTHYEGGPVELELGLRSSGIFGPRGNIEGGVVLVCLDVDDMYSTVQVEPGGRANHDHLAALEDAIFHLELVRDTLRSLGRHSASGTAYAADRADATGQTL